MYLSWIEKSGWYESKAIVCLLVRFCRVDQSVRLNLYLVQWFNTGFDPYGGVVWAIEESDLWFGGTYTGFDIGLRINIGRGGVEFVCVWIGHTYVAIITNGCIACCN